VNLYHYSYNGLRLNIILAVRKRKSKSEDVPVFKFHAMKTYPLLN